MIYDYAVILDDLDPAKDTVGTILRELSDYEIIGCNLSMDGDDPHTLWVTGVEIQFRTRGRPGKITTISIKVDTMARVYCDYDHVDHPYMDVTIWPADKREIPEDMTMTIKATLDSKLIAAAALNMHELWYGRKEEEK